MLYHLSQSPAFQTLITALGWITLFLLGVAVVVLAAVAISYAVLWFIKTYYKTILAVCFCAVLIGVAVLYFAPII